eukprot:c18262_g1_i1.p1 GENE.c18262_g1_i1~~c18262_g1_i1.p1  ORF type:complete len:216 (-),score=27.11 c18262_g1_i1:50-697(-)
MGALLACVIVIARGFATDLQVLFVWRVFFFANAAIESGMIFWSLLLIRNLTHSQNRTKSMQSHLLITLYMRGGIAVAIILKFFNIFPFQVLAIVHLWFVFTGLFAYHLRVLWNDPRKFSIVRWFRRADLVVLNQTESMVGVTRPRPNSQKLAIALFGTTPGHASYPPTNPTKSLSFHPHSSYPPTIVPAGGAQTSVLEPIPQPLVQTPIDQSVHL